MVNEIDYTAVDGVELSCEYFVLILAFVMLSMKTYTINIPRVQN